MGRLHDKKIALVRFRGPVWVDGLGMVDKLDTTPDPDTGKARLEGVSITWLAEECLLRVSTSAGETLISAECSMKPIYEAFAGTKGAKK